MDRRTARFLSRPERFRMMAASAREDIEYRFDINRTAQIIVSLASQAKGNATDNGGSSFQPEFCSAVSGNGVIYHIV